MPGWPHRSFDLLFVNAGVTNDPQETVGEVSTEEFIRVMVTNALSPMRVIERLEELVPPAGTIAVMSSGLAAVADNEAGGWEVYRGSKAALNTLMRSFAARHAAIRGACWSSRRAGSAPIWAARRPIWTSTPASPAWPPTHHGADRPTRLRYPRLPGTDSTMVAGPSARIRAFSVNHIRARRTPRKGRLYPPARVTHR